VTIDVLSDNVFFDIFDYYIQEARLWKDRDVEYTGTRVSYTCVDIGEASCLNHHSAPTSNSSAQNTCEGDAGYLATLANHDTGRWLNPGRG
jgi:hypothetical protein